MCMVPSREGTRMKSSISQSDANRLAGELDSLRVMKSEDQSALAENW